MGKILYVLFSEILNDKQDKYKVIEKFNLSDFFWKSIESNYRYKSNNSSVKDLLLCLIQDHFKRSIKDGNQELNREAYLFVNRWKENTNARKIFSDWSKKLEKIRTLKIISGVCQLKAIRS
ncbi:MAG: hypothetical protein IPG78_11585 [Ignavibacteria bacterium]|nr:hypothetical protein [Ignavibacteria bacterium]